MKAYRKIASLLTAIENCKITGNAEWEKRHFITIERIIKDHFPSGSGFDSGTTLDMGESNGEKLVFYTSFHHMDENGFYDGWTEHKVIVTPSLSFGYNLRITGKDRNDIKEYIADCFIEALEREIGSYIS